MLITIAVYNTLAEAHVAASLLGSFGVEASVADQSLGSYAPISEGGIRLQVARADVEKALNVLAGQAT